MPFLYILRVYSTKEKGFKSQNIETIKGLDFVKSHFGNQGIYALDRWYDNNRFYKYFTKNNDECNFVIRAKKLEMLFIKGKQ
ncbi:hypothetical protein [Halobacteroides halobius]|uniref:hypothetical protein n=1 Tax=Halobacteroides halobius TaxID=42422 RepID=UPI00145EA150|nr:hypothetical protein [Halobacteroides halobius]